MQGKPLSSRWGHRLHPSRVSAVPWPQGFPDITQPADGVKKIDLRNKKAHERHLQMVALHLPWVAQENGSVVVLLPWMGKGAYVSFPQNTLLTPEKSVNSLESQNFAKLPFPYSQR